MPRPIPSTSESRSSPLLALPTELLLHLLASLPLESLLALSRTSRDLRSIVTEQALPTFLRKRAYAPVTVRPRFSHSSVVSDARWMERIQCRWEDMSLRGETLGGSKQGEWRRRVMPLVRLWDRGTSLLGRVIVARGEEIDLWQVRPDGSSERVPMLDYRSSLSRAYGSGGPATSQGGAWHDITGVQTLDHTQLILSRVNGLVQRVRVVEPRWDLYYRHWIAGWLEEVARYDVGQEGLRLNTETSVQTMTVGGDVLVAATTTRPRTFSRGQRQRAIDPPSVQKPGLLSTSPVFNLTFSSISAPWIPSTLVELKSKPWSLLFSPSTSTPTWLAVGTSSIDSPLALYDLDQDARPLRSTPPRLLGGTVSNSTIIDDAAMTSSAVRKRTSVYALCTPHPLSTALNPQHTLIAGYYDSSTRLYDLRQHSSRSELTLRDPLSDDASYSLASAGPNGAYILVGTARHGAIRIWDVRQTKVPLSGTDSGSRGQTVFAPGHDASPVYSIAAESSRVWGVTDRRAFVLEFDHAACDSKSSDFGGEKARTRGLWFGRDLVDVSWYQHGGVGAGRLRSGQRGRGE